MSFTNPMIATTATKMSRAGNAIIGSKQTNPAIIIATSIRIVIVIIQITPFYYRGCKIYEKKEGVL